LHRSIRQLSGETWRSRPVWFSHGAPANMATHLRVFGPWVEFRRDCNGIVLEVDDLDAPLPASDPAMARHLKSYLEPMLAQAHESVSEKARRLIYDLLVSRRASADHVAAYLGKTRRTLQRQLARDGETFSSLRDAVRSDLAQRYVEDSELPLSEVAHLLGFSEESAFSRWFRAEFKCSPMSWRIAERGEAKALAPGALQK
jgi:AraC-like DNA-binding protein